MYPYIWTEMAYWWPHGKAGLKTMKMLRIFTPEVSTQKKTVNQRIKKTVEVVAEVVAEAAYPTSYC